MILNDDIPVVTVNSFCKIEVGFINMMGLTQSAILNCLTTNLDPEELYQCIASKKGVGTLVNAELEKFIKTGDHLVVQSIYLPSSNHYLIRGRYPHGIIAYEINIFPNPNIFS